MTKRFSNLDSLKFIFSVVIIYFHLVRSIPKWVGNSDFFSQLAQDCKGCHLIVECFLIIAGAFIYSGYKRHQKSFIDFSISRIVRLWPVMFVYVVSIGLLRNVRLESLLADLFFLRCTGLSLENKEIVWYISPFFWGSLFIFAALQAFKQKISLLLFAVIAWIAYSININYLGGNVGREIVYSWLSLGMIRCIAGLCVGVLLAALQEAYQINYQQFPKTQLVFLFSSIVEITCCGLLIYIFFVDKIILNSFIVIVLFSFLLLSFTSLKGGGCISFLLRNNFLSSFGKYCYSIYVMQLPSFIILEKTLWKKPWFWESSAIGLFLSLLFSVGIGISVYYLIEKPGYQFLNSFFSKLRKSANSQK